MSWKKLLEDGSLQEKKISFEEVSLVFKKASKCLKTAEFLFSNNIDDEASFKDAYDAMLMGGRALIFALGYKPRTTGSHAIVINFCELFLGLDFKPLVSKLKKTKEKRNYLIYGAGLEISHTEAKNIIDSAKEFLKVIEEEIMKIKNQKRLI